METKPVLKNDFSFWWYWLVAVVAGVILFGLALVLAPSFVEILFNWMLFSVSKANTSFNVLTVTYLRFVYQVLGAVMVGWGVSLLCILGSSFRRGERQGWYALTASIVIWFGLDSGSSILSGFGENAILNCVFFILFAIPLAATFHPKEVKII